MRKRTLIEDDIFFWSWKDPSIHSYHCKSQIAIVQRGKLRDTFWCGNEGVLNLKDIKIRYQGNIHEMTVISSYTTPYYRPRDIVDMRHSNSSQAPVYLKPRAARSQSAMRIHVKYLIEKSESDIQMAKMKIDLFGEALKVIETDELDKVYL